MKENTTHLPPDFADPRRLAGLAPDTPLAVAFSGGADSVALLSMLRDSGKIHAVHVHHGIRGAEADRDAAFCRETAATLGIPFTLLWVDVPALSKERGESMETAARNARYAAITAWMREMHIPLLVTAHHADDQLETMLQHLLRGSGTRGLGGIPACRPLDEGLWVVRPLLRIPKAALLRYVEDEGLSFVTDSTNEELCCQRNFLRHRVLPLLEELRPNAAAAAARCAEALAEDEQYLGALAEDFLQKEEHAPTITALRALPPPIFVRVMQRLLPVSPEAIHIALLQELLSNEKPYAALSLPHCRVRIEKGRLRVLTAEPPPWDGYELPLSEGRHQTENGAVLISVGNTPPLSPEETARYRYATTIELNASIIKGKLFARPRRPGDRILCGGMHKAVRRLQAMTNLPPEVRARMPLLFDEEGPLAIPFGPLRDGVRGNTLTVTLHFN